MEDTSERERLSPMELSMKSDEITVLLVSIITTVSKCEDFYSDIPARAIEALKIHVELQAKIRAELIHLHDENLNLIFGLKGA